MMWVQFLAKTPDSSILLMQILRAEVMVQVVGFLSFVWETWTEFLVLATVGIWGLN